MRYRTPSLLAAALAAGALASAAPAQTVVNVDVGQGGPAYAGLGVAPDAPRHTVWNSIKTSGQNLTASDGSPTTVSVSLTSAGGFTYGNPNTLLGDYQFLSVFQSKVVGELAITGLTPDTNYLIYVYGSGNAVDQGGAYTLNGVTCTTGGSTSAEFIEAANYALLEVESDGAGEIRGEWRPLNAATALNGLQITESLLPSRVVRIAGAESPTVHSPGDPLRVTLEFSEPVDLSQAGGARILLDYEDQVVEALQVGPTSGTALTFEGPAPAVTTLDGRVRADSLELLNGALLVNSDFLGVDLGHAEFPLPYDQVSVQGLSVYPPVPGLNPSPHYRFRVREIGGPWLSPFAHLTACPNDDDSVPYGYMEDQIGGWSHTYCNFELANNVPVEVEITRLGPDGQTPVAIERATPHPRRKVKSWRVEDGKAIVTIDRPTLFAIDVDGELDDAPTPIGQFINEDAKHTVSVFANPFILDKPDLSDVEHVLAIAPGTIPSDSDPRKTFYFLPGVHQIFDGDWDLGEDFRLHSDRTYYIPGDAVVHGNFNNRDDAGDARNIRLYGHGTVSGERMLHPIAYGLTNEELFRWFSPLRIADDARGCSVEGITFADPAFHTCVLLGDFTADPADRNHVRWTKAMSWRANGDGISPNGSSIVEDCFLRTQDDGTYILGLAIRRMVYWTDVNGMPLRCSQLTSKSAAAFLDQDLVVEDIDVIYARGGFSGGPGLSVIGYPDPNAAFPGNDGSHVVFRDVNVEDPFPTRRLFGWDLATGNGAEGALSGVRFENVRAVAPTVANDPDTFLGVPLGPIEGLIFEDVTLAGRHYADMADFELNAFVSDFDFRGTAPEPRYLNTSGDGKWYLNDDWSGAVEPADNDLVEHTSVGGTLTVDARAYAGALEVGHAETATVAVRESGRLALADSISIGAAAPGGLDLLGGVVRLENAAPGALSVGSGALHFERGKLVWSGEHVAEIQALFDAGAITFADGRPAQAVAISGTLGGGKDASTLIDRAGSTLLHARYNAGADTTSVWAEEFEPLPRRR
jgi:hypothetical protein